MSDIQYGQRTLYHPLGKVYLFGDVHNEADKLVSVLDQIEPIITPEDHIVFCGDLVDRGPQAALTVKILVDLARKYPEQVFFIRGNHDWMLQHYLATGSSGWMQYLQITLDNYKAEWNLPNVDPDTITGELIKRGFREITSRMIPYYETNELIATHAPLDLSVVLMNGGDHYAELYADRVNNPGFIHLLERMDHEILWQFTDENMTISCVDKFRVCGHQPSRGKHARIFKDRAFIDSGCGKGDRPLTCMVWPGKKIYQSQS